MHNNGRDARLVCEVCQCAWYIDGQSDVASDHENLTGEHDVDDVALVATLLSLDPGHNSLAMKKSPAEGMLHHSDEPALHACMPDDLHAYATRCMLTACPATAVRICRYRIGVKQGACKPRPQFFTVFRRYIYTAFPTLFLCVRRALAWATLTAQVALA